MALELCLISQSAILVTSGLWIMNSLKLQKASLPLPIETAKNIFSFTDLSSKFWLHSDEGADWAHSLDNPLELGLASFWYQVVSEHHGAMQHKWSHLGPCPTVLAVTVTIPRYPWYFQRWWSTQEHSRSWGKTKNLSWPFSDKFLLPTWRYPVEVPRKLKTF